MLDACPVHPKGTMVIPMLWRISGYVVCMMGVKNKNHHTHPYRRNRGETPDVTDLLQGCFKLTFHKTKTYGARETQQTGRFVVTFTKFHDSDFG
jgi:hypothetical protein